MAVKAEEISAILKEKIEQYNFNPDMEEVGRVLSVGDGIATVYGLTGVEYNEMVEFSSGVSTKKLMVGVKGGAIKPVICTVCPSLFFSLSENVMPSEETPAYISSKVMLIAASALLHKKGGL